MMGDCGDFVPYAHFSTQAIHVGSEPEQWNSRAVVPPISLATTFKQDEPGKQIAVCTVFTTVSWTTVSGYILELEQPRKTAKIPQIFSDFYYE